MQIDRSNGGWAAGPRPRIGVVAVVAIVIGAVLGGLIGRLIEATVLRGASFAVIALGIVGAALGGLYATSLTVGTDDDLREDADDSRLT
jgi:uncharacterized membrane protein YeaQ/YmgE (transglycosylase-associated protein family)